MKKILILIFALLAVMACEEDKGPKNIISEGKMEDVLYDYHKAQSMIDQLPYEQRDKMAQAYIDAVFTKYDITQAEFDSSLVYYNRHAEDLNDIYADLKERFDEENQELAMSTGNDVMAVTSQNGDTANIWNGAKLAVLRCKEGLNYECFTFKADSSFHRQDKFILVCGTTIISENNGNPDNYINIGLTITYKDGRTTATTMRTSTSRDMQLEVNATEDKDIASISGFFYYNGNKDLRNLGIVSGIGLVRMRTIVDKPMIEEVDTIKLDTLPSQTEEHKHEEHLSPEQMRKKNQSGNHIQIKAAPDVRTPNSTFTRRRKSQKK